MKAAEYLSNLATALETARKADSFKLMSPIGGVSKIVFVSLTNKGVQNLDETFKKELVEWFMGGKLSTYRKTSVAYGERKNSRKKITTQIFLAERDGLQVQLGHISTKNYQPCFWERGSELLVKSALCKEGEFSYYNNSFVDYAMQMGAKFEDQGEKN